MRYEDLTDKIIGVFFEVYNILGYGFLEKVYENAMRKEFERMGVNYVSQYPIKVYYKDDIVGEYIADFLIDGKIIVELKAIRELSLADESQLLNYLKSTDKEVGLLLNFGKRAEIKRKMFDNNMNKTRALGQ
jgi:GxxExxY protein